MDGILAEFKAVFANTSITIKVLEPGKGEKGDFYWGMVDQAAPKDVFLMKATGAMKVKELKAAIFKEKGYAVESQRLMYFGGELEETSFHFKAMRRNAKQCKASDPHDICIY